MKNIYQQGFSIARMAGPDCVVRPAEFVFFTTRPTGHWSVSSVFKYAGCLLKDPNSKIESIMTNSKGYASFRIKRA